MSRKACCASVCYVLHFTAKIRTVWLPMENSATCLKDFGSCRSRGHRMVEVKVAQIGALTISQTVQVPRQVHLL